jgi:hypothetical protein
MQKFVYSYDAPGPYPFFREVPQERDSGLFAAVITIFILLNNRANTAHFARYYFGTPPGCLAALVTRLVKIVCNYRGIFWAASWLLVNGKCVEEEGVHAAYSFAGVCMDASAGWRPGVVDLLF